MEQAGLAVKNNDAALGGADLNHLRQEIDAHVQHDRKESYIGKAVDFFNKEEDASLKKLRQLSDNQTVKSSSNEISQAIEADKKALKSHDFITNCSAQFASTVGLLWRGPAGLAIAGTAFAADQMKPADDAGTQLVDGALGVAKGKLMRSLFSFGRIQELNPIMQGATLGTASGALSVGLNRDTYFNEKGQFDTKQAATTFASTVLNPASIVLDAATFGVGYGLAGTLGRLSPDMVVRNPLLYTAFSGSMYGAVSGATNEYFQEKKDGGQINYGDIAKNSLAQAAILGLAGVPGGLQRTQSMRWVGQKIKPQVYDYNSLVPDPSLNHCADREAANYVCRELQKRDEWAEIVGGGPRNDLLGLKAKDWDVATSASPTKTKKILNGYDVGTAQGVVGVNVGDSKIEVTQYRRDIYQDADGRKIGNGRKPGFVKPESYIGNDAMRRDFTVNNFSLEPISGKLITWNNGLEDLKNKTLRFVSEPGKDIDKESDKRIDEDVLRELRAYRFISQLGFTPHPSLVEALKRNAHKIIDTYVDEEDGKTKKVVTDERVTGEMKKIFESDNPLAALDLMMETGVMKYRFPDIAEMDGPNGEQDPCHHPEISTWAHTRLVLQELKKIHPEGKPSFVEYMGALLHDWGKPRTREVQENGKITNRNHDKIGAQMVSDILDKQMQLSKDEKKAIRDIIDIHMEMHFPPEKVSKLATRVNLPDFQFYKRMQHADAMGTTAPLEERLAKSKYDFYTQKEEELRAKPEAQRPDAKPIITGNDLVAAADEVGVKLTKGPIRRVLLEEALQAQLEGSFSDSEGGYQWLRQQKALLEDANKAQIEGAFSDYQGAMQWMKERLMRKE